MIDKLGRDLSVPIEPIDTYEWEMIQIDGEGAMMGASNGSETKEEQIQKLGKYILALSAEILRLRLTYGEKIWESVYHSKEENDFIRKIHETERYKHQILKP